MTRFATAADIVPEPCAVAGVVLRPFCLGHHLLFLRLGLPFAGGIDVDYGFEETLLGIAICGGESYETTLEELHLGTWPDTLARWRKKLLKRRLFLPRHTLDPLVIDTDFREYLKRGYQLPPLWHYPESASAITITSPWETLLIARLVSAGLSRSEVINGYLPAMWYHYYTVGELSAADNCTQPEKWRRVFVTCDDVRRLNRVAES